MIVNIILYIFIFTMSVSLLESSYLNRRYNHFKIKKEIDWRYFQPVVFTGTGVALVNSLRKVLMDEVDCFTVKTSLKLEDYEQSDQKGNSYLDRHYSAHYSIDTRQNFFDTVTGLETATSSDRSKYIKSSGYAKIIRVDDNNQIIYDGIEHTQILTDKLGYIPINSELDYIYDKKNNQRVPLDQLWIFIGKTVDKKNFDPKTIEPIVNIDKHKMLNVTVSNSIIVCYYRDDKWHNITSDCVPNGYAESEVEVPDKGVTNKLFSCNTLITCLKPGQKIKAHMRLDRGTGRQYAKWLPVICRYKFATQDDLDNKAEEIMEDNFKQRQFLITKDPLINSVFINEPESIILTLESIYKLNVPNVLNRAFTVMQNWFFQFRNQLYDLFLTRCSEDKAGQRAFKHPMLKIEKFEYPELVLQLRDCNHNFIGLLIDVLIRYLVELVRRRPGDKIDILKSWFQQTIIAYRQRHPLRQEVYLTIKYPVQLLETIEESDLDKYFFDGQTKTVSGLYNGSTLCKVLYLVLSSLDHLDEYLEKLKFNVEKAFNDKINNGKTSLELRKQYENYSYNFFLKNKQILTHYNEEVTQCLPPGFSNGQAICSPRNQLLSELYYLSKFVTSDLQNNYVVVYSGSADSNHHLLLRELYPLLNFVLFDPKCKKCLDIVPDDIDLDRDKYLTFSRHFDDNMATLMAKLATRDKKEILFISAPKQEKQSNTQIYEYNCSLYHLISKQGKSFRASMINFNLPSKDNLSTTDELKYNEFFRGEINIHPYASLSKTSLIVTREDLYHKDQIITYDEVKYREFFSYIDNVVRRSMKFSMPKISKQPELHQKYDHLLELYILNQYVQTYYTREISTCEVEPYDKLRELLEKIEREPTMVTVHRF